MNGENLRAPASKHSFEMQFEGYFSTIEEQGRDRRAMIDGWFWVTVEGHDVETCRSTAVEMARTRLEETFDVAPFSMFRSRYVGENEGHWALEESNRVGGGIWQSGMLLVRSRPWGPRRWWYALRAWFR
jgi:hypothetical protein